MSSPAGRRRCGARFDLDRLSEQLQEIRRELEDPRLWDSPTRATALLREQSELAATCDPFQRLEQDRTALSELLKTSAPDESELDTLALELRELKTRWDRWEAAQHPDSSTVQIARVLLKAGTGGTESQDFTQMLARMYVKWAQRRGYEITWLERTPGETAGLREAMVRICGPQAYTLLASESGIHRLCRKSPFGSGVRHTSFVSVEVTEELLEEPIQIVIRESDLTVQTFRASGKGGQHLNKTESAVRIQHHPSGITVRCQAERCQHANRAAALRELHRQLTELESARRARLRQAQCLARPAIDFGRQIRTYALDQSRITDHRTGCESRQAQAILEGNLDLLTRAAAPADPR